jgi:glucan 1,3-beta-glucosidase
MASGGPTSQSVGSVTFIDSTIAGTQVAFVTAYESTSQPPTAGSLILENIVLSNVPVAVQGPSGTALQGGTRTITAWGEGHEYTPNGPLNFEGAIPAFSRPPSLTSRGKYYFRSKPQYEALPVSSFVSVRTAGAKGDGIADDTAAINKVLKSAAYSNLVVFFDAGTYKVTSTINVPPGSKIVGESYSVIMAAGAFFSNIKAPQPVVLVGTPGQEGVVEWSDMIVSTQGAASGAILIEWHLASTAGTPSGIWDVHTRIGGFAGSNLQVAQCPTTPNSTDVINKNCIAAFMSIYIAPSTKYLYLENNWFWTADHDIEDPNETQITIYTGRGLYDASENGPVWLVGTAVEHHAFYQYQFANTKDVYAGQIQTETPYWQPNPNAAAVFPIVPGFNDPDFVASCEGVSGNCADAWGLRVISSQSILVYGAGLYSFFDNYSVVCSDAVTPPGGNGASCQTRIVSIEGSDVQNVNVYNLNTIGAAQMVTRDGKSLASYSDNVNVYPDTIALFRTN